MKNKIYTLVTSSYDADDKLMSNIEVFSTIDTAKARFGEKVCQYENELDIEFDVDHDQVGAVVCEATYDCDDYPLSINMTVFECVV